MTPSPETSPEASSAQQPVAHWGAVYALSLCAFVMVASEFLPVSLLTPMASDLNVKIINRYLGGTAVAVASPGGHAMTARI